MNWLQRSLHEDFPISQVLVAFAAVVLVRMFLERLLESGQVFSYGKDFYETLVEHVHYFLFRVSLLLVLALLVRIFIRLPLAKSLRLVVLCSPLIWLPPLQRRTGSVAYRRAHLARDANPNQRPHDDHHEVHVVPLTREA